MPVTVGGQRIASRNPLGRGSLISFKEAWKRIEPVLPQGSRQSAMITLLSYKEGHKAVEFSSWDVLVADLREASSARPNGSLARKNKFFKEGDENNNVAAVVYASNVPQTSNGWNNTEFFENLGLAANQRLGDEKISSKTLQQAAAADEQEFAGLATQALHRRAEQKYLMQNMAKGPMFEAAQYEYRGHYASYTEPDGPCIRLKLRPDENMYGDHDLVVFTEGDRYGKIIQDEKRITQTQVALQEANSFQAQHGGIWDWVPGTDFNRNIRRVIKGGHSPPDGEPLVYIQPSSTVTAAFSIPGSGGGDQLASVWDCPEATKWLKSTLSRSLLVGA